jgi:hypothetical protein
LAEEWTNQETEKKAKPSVEWELELETGKEPDMDRERMTGMRGEREEKIEKARVEGRKIDGELVPGDLVSYYSEVSGVEMLCTVVC